MEVIEISQYTPRKEPERKKRRSGAAVILAMAVKAGLFIGTAAVAYKAIVLAAEFAQARATLPGGEIFTVPLIAALFVAGYVLRGDVEAVRRQKRKERRRKAREQRSQ